MNRVVYKIRDSIPNSRVNILFLAFSLKIDVKTNNVQNVPFLRVNYK